MKPRLHVIAVGGSHQIYHFLPAVFELARRGAVAVTVFVTSDAERSAVERLAAQLGYAAPVVVVMRLPGLLERLFPQGRRKLPVLLWWAKRLRDADALLSAERTSTVLKRIPGACPTFIHIPHGVGDRAVGFERRIALFDHILVAGEKDRDRLVGMGRVPPGRCHVAGAIKIAAILRMNPERPALFDNDRPVVLYNPHFHSRLSSFEAAAEPLLDQVTAHGGYNLVIAPHVRLAQRWSASQRASWESRAVPGRVIVDLGSERSMDMSYTLGADIYVGDVSSQIYEFLVRPRPCLFIDAHGADWRDDPDYAMWHLGPVVSADADLIAAIERARAEHGHYRPLQQSRLAEVMADYPLGPERPPASPDAIDRAATILEDILGPN